MREDALKFINFAIISDGSLSEELFFKILKQDPDCIHTGMVYELRITDDQEASDEEILELLSSPSEINANFYMYQDDCFKYIDPYSSGVAKVLYRARVTGINLKRLASKYSITNKELIFDIIPAITTLNLISDIEIIQKLS